MNNRQGVVGYFDENNDICEREYETRGINSDIPDETKVHEIWTRPIIEPASNYKAECWSRHAEKSHMYFEMESNGDTRVEALKRLLDEVRDRKELFERLEQSIANQIKEES